MFERLVMSSLAKIYMPSLTHLVTRNSLRLGYAQRDFDHL